MEPLADMECCLKVHSKCDSCMMKTTEVLQSIRGVYSVTWDAQQNLFKICGEVDPNLLLKAVLRIGDHAELVTVKLKHPELRLRNYNNYGSYGPNTSHHVPPYSVYPSWREQPYYVSNNPNPYIMPPEPTPVPDRFSDHDHRTQMPKAVHLPSYPYHEYGPNDNVDGSNCSIM